MIRIENISAGYGKTEVIRTISAAAHPGELIALVGPNGSGKSTLIKTLCGLIRPTQGQVYLGDTNLSDLPPKTRARQIAYLPQARIAQAGMTASDIIELGRAPWRGRLGQISKAGQDAIELAIEKTQTRGFLTRNFEALSGGEQARVLLARALAVGADVLLADEPIAALDPYYQLTMMETLKAESASGKTVITALHDLSLARQFADRIWVMNKGRIVADDVPEAALSETVLKTVFRVRMENGRWTPI